MIPDAFLQEIVKQGPMGLLVLVLLYMLWRMWKQNETLHDSLVEAHKERVADLKVVTTVLETSTNNINRTIEFMREREAAAETFRVWVRSTIENLTRELIQANADRRARLEQQLGERRNRGKHDTGRE